MTFNKVIRACSIVLFLNPKFAIRNPKLFNYFIRSRQYVRRYRQADLLGGLQIDDELELDRLLHWKISWLGTFQNLVHIGSGAAIQVGNARAIAHKPAALDVFGAVVGCRKSALYRKLCDLSLLSIEDWAR